MSQEPISCYTMVDIPAYACFFAPDIMNPVPYEEPTMVATFPSTVTRPPDIGAPPDSSLAPGNYLLDEPVLWMWDGSLLQWLSVVRQCALHPLLMTNGPVSIPGKTSFSAWQLAYGIHWLKYDDGIDAEGKRIADPANWWFYPRTDTWFLGSFAGGPGRLFDGIAVGSFRVPSILFRRIGATVTVKKCVPVVMMSGNYQQPQTIYPGAF